MGTCVRCQTYFGFFSGVHLHPKTNRCPSCEQKMGTCVRCQNERDFELPNGVLLDPETDRCPSCERSVMLIKKIKEGNLPTVNPGDEIHLDSDETCYLDAKSRHEKNGDGQLIATNKRLLFLSEHGGVDVNWKRVMRIS